MTPIGSGPSAGSATQSPPSKAKLDVASLSNNTRFRKVTREELGTARMDNAILARQPSASHFSVGTESRRGQKRKEHRGALGS